MSDQVIATTEQIAKRAYDLYTKRGREHGRDLDDWLRAEKQLVIELNETPEQRLVRVATAAAYSLSANPHMIRTRLRRR